MQKVRNVNKLLRKAGKI